MSLPSVVTSASRKRALLALSVLPRPNYISAPTGMMGPLNIGHGNLAPSRLDSPSSHLPGGCLAPASHAKLFHNTCHVRTFYLEVPGIESEASACQSNTQIQSSLISVLFLCIEYFALLKLKVSSWLATRKILPIPVVKIMVLKSESMFSGHGSLDMAVGRQNGSSFCRHANVGDYRKGGGLEWCGVHFCRGGG